MHPEKEVIYQLVVEDLQTVARDVLHRKLKREEIDILKEAIGDYIHWYDAIEYAILTKIKINNRKRIS